MLSVKNLSKSYSSKEATVNVLRDISITVGAGDMCALTGSSGSGKTTLMNIIGLLDSPSAGEVLFGDRTTSKLPRYELAKLRNETIGFVFQSFHLLPRYTALENEGLPLIYRGTSYHERARRSYVALEKVGLSDRAGHKPDELSGGQRQRVAIARALVGDPAFLLADEPTGNLDGDAAAEIMELFLTLNTLEKTTLLIVTHDASIAARCKRRIVLKDGTERYTKAPA